MDWSKLDAGLAVALEEAGGPARFEVFVQLAGPLGGTLRKAMGNTGLEVPADQEALDLLTLSVDRAQVAALSLLPNVRALTLSHTLRPLRKPS